MDRSTSLQHKSVGAGRNLFGSEGDFVSDASAQVNNFCWSMAQSFVVWILPEADLIAGEMTPTATPVAQTIHIFEEGKEALLFDLKEIQ